MHIVCAWCKKDLGVKLSPGQDDDTSHGICVECQQAQLAELRELRGESI
jgi:hypothetical protein